MSNRRIGPNVSMSSGAIDNKNETIELSAKCTGSQSTTLLPTFSKDLSDLNQDFLDHCGRTIEGQDACFLFQTFPEYIHYFMRMLIEHSKNSGASTLISRSEYQLFDFFKKIRLMEFALYEHCSSQQDAESQTDDLEIIEMPKRIAYVGDKPRVQLRKPATPVLRRGEEEREYSYQPQPRLKIDAESKVFGTLVPLHGRSVEKDSRDHLVGLMHNITTAKVDWNCDLCLAGNVDAAKFCKCCDQPRSCKENDKQKTPPPAPKPQKTPDLCVKETQAEPLKLLTSNTKGDEWKCFVCLIQNDLDSKNCVCCGSQRPLSKVPSMQSEPQSKSEQQINETEAPVTKSQDVIIEESTPDLQMTPTTVQALEQEKDHYESDAFYKAKCKFYYLKDDKYHLRSYGFLSCVKRSDYTALIFRADNFQGDTMLSVRLNRSMNPQVASKKNVRFICIPHPELYAGQPNDKGIVCVMKMATNEQAEQLREAMCKC
ncbi:hypothetical protein ACOME3_010782 [Neoechinorhynchus agilis]